MAYKKEKKIKVDIILPNFNSAEYIKETIKSILNQSFKNWNLIIFCLRSGGVRKRLEINPKRSENDPKRSENDPKRSENSSNQNG